MSFDWADYLELADVIVQQRSALGTEEACLRAAISRAYYSAFITARNFVDVKREVILTRRGQDHHLVIDHFKNSADRNRRQIGSWLDRLAINRRKADYENVILGPLPMAMSSVQQARNVLSAIVALP